MFGLYDMFSGGALQQFSVFVLGIMPYITASIIIQVLTMVVPQLERLSKEGQQGRNQITQYTRYATIGVAMAQALFMALSMEQMKTSGNADIVLNPGWGFRLLTMVTLMAGSCFVMWLGEQISERGIGNGSSLIITAGIISHFPTAAVHTYQKVQLGEVNLLQITILVALMIGVIGAIVWIERGQRRIPIQYAKRVVGRRIYGGQSAHLPLKINTTGVIPPIFASSLLAIPMTVSGLAANNVIVEAVVKALAPGEWLYNYTYIVLIVFFSYFYTAMMFNPVDVADNLKKNGAYIPGLRPGKQTADYIDRLLTRLTAAGSLYLAALCILPTILISRFGVPFSFGGTGLLIVVGVSLDTVQQIEAQLLAREYDGIQGPGQAKGRRRLLFKASQGAM